MRNVANVLLKVAVAFAIPFLWFEFTGKPPDLDTVAMIFLGYVAVGLIDIAL